MERTANILQHTEGKLPNSDNVVQGTHDDRNSSHFEKPSFSKHTLEGFDSKVIRDGSQEVFNFPRLT